MATFVNDTFTDTDSTALDSHTGETGATWTAHASATQTANITSNSVHADNTTGTAFYYASGSPAGTDYYAQATVIGFTGGRHGVCVRITIAATEFYWFRQNGTDAEIYKKSATGSLTLVDSAAGVVSVGSVLKLSATGTNPVVLTGYVDDVQQCSYSDSDADRIQTAGVAGLRLSAQTSSGLDSFSAADIAGAATTGIPLVDGGLVDHSRVNGGLVHRAMTKIGDLWLPDRRITRPRLIVPVGIALQGA